MTKLPIISGRDCVAALEKIRFAKRWQTGSHMIMQRNDPYAVVSMPNHKTLRKGTPRRIIREAGLTVEEFAELL